MGGSLPHHTAALSVPYLQEPGDLGAEREGGFQKALPEYSQSTWQAAATEDAGASLWEGQKAPQGDAGCRPIGGCPVVRKGRGRVQSGTTTQCEGARRL